MRDQTHLRRAVRAEHAGAPRRGVSRLHATSGREHAAHTAGGQSRNSRTRVRLGKHPDTTHAIRPTMDAGPEVSIVCKTFDADYGSPARPWETPWTPVPTDDSPTTAI